MVNNASCLIKAESENVHVKQEPDTVINGQLTLTKVNGTSRLFQEDEKESNTLIQESYLLKCREELYAGHVVKEELVIGPEMLQQPDRAATSGIYKVRESARLANRELRVRASAVRRTYGNRRKGSQCPTVLKDVENDKSQKSDKKMENDNTREWECDKKHTAPILKRENQSVEKEVNESENIKLNDCYLNSVQDSYITETLDSLEIKTINSKLNKDPQYSHNEHKYLTVTGETLDEDLRPQDTSRPFVCDLCGFGWYRKQSLVNHIYLCHSEARCVFDICKYNCSHKSNNITHHIKHSKVNLKVSHNSYLNDNFSRHPRKRYSCAHCTYSCSHRNNLIVHLRKHTGEKPFTCTYCTYSARHSNSLKNHITKHTGEKPYTCTYCKHSFSQQINLKNHLRKHTDQKPYNCTYCTYSCKYSNSLKDHIRKHTGEKPYTCTYCTYSARHSNSLKNHITKHTGEKPYTCTYCKHSFSEQINLKKHTGKKP